ncbi:MAG: hypothetical protein AB7K71_14445 [Polyangiaceae bacterium]
MAPFHSLGAALATRRAAWFVSKAGLGANRQVVRHWSALRYGVAFLSLLATLAVLSSTAWAGCPEQVAWAKQCDDGNFRFEVQACPAGVIVGTARIKGGDRLPIEVKAATQGSFRRVGDTGVQPIGEFADWNTQPKSQRDALEAMLACVKRAGPPPLPEASAPELQGPKSARLLVIGLLLLCGALGLRASLLDKASRKQLRRSSLLVCAFALAVAFLRWWLTAPAMFHQNGQGPLWVLLALDRPDAPQIYGPGYTEVCGWLATRLDPELAVYVMNATLFALALPAAFASARGLGLSRGPAWALVGAMALHPLGARLASSESYYATISGLSMLACLAMVLAVQGMHELSTPRRRWLFISGTLAAGVLIAQAARIHPIGWAPLACLGFIPLCAPGPTRRIFIRTAIICGVIAVLVSVTSLLSMLHVLTGELGQKWLPATTIRWERMAKTLALCGVLWVIARRRQALLPALGFCSVLAIMTGSHPVAGASPRIADAVPWLYLPAALACFAAWLAQIGSLARLVCCACAVGAGLGWGWENRSNYLTLSTDALEIRAANSWKHELGAGAYVAYVSRAKQRVLVLPFYDKSEVGSARLADDAQTIATPSFYYYRSSICSTPDGRDLCARIEARLELTPLKEITLPAVASLAHLPLDPQPITVVLFKAKLRRQQPTP